MARHSFPRAKVIIFAFETREKKAAAFEAYLKSGSGHVFAKRHFQYLFDDILHKPHLLAKQIHSRTSREMFKSESNDMPPPTVDSRIECKSEINYSLFAEGRQAQMQ